MNVIEVISLMQLKEKKEITKTKLAELLGVSYTYLQRIKEKDLPQHYIEGLEHKLKYKLQSNSSSSNLHTLDDGVEIPYWEGCEEFGSFTKNPRVRSTWFDKEIGAGLWDRDFKTLRIINMFTNKMAGGTYPIFENDVLLFDISDTNFSKGGVFVFTTGEGCYKNLFICKVSPNPDATGVIFSYNNPNYQPKYYTYGQLEKAKFTIVGRVLKDITITI